MHALPLFCYFILHGYTLERLMLEEEYIVTYQQRKLGVHLLLHEMSVLSIAGQIIMGFEKLQK